ncbi:MAG: tyrosine-type recombinase/integrase [Clostridiales bacterium]|jgi:integrase|nr:tyrosine-type recombinase/integrase [Clostridiales bacterium]
MPKRGKDGYYREDIELFRGPDDKRKRKTIRGKTLKEFNRNLEEAKRLYAKGIALNDITVYEWGERWRSVYKGKVNEERQEHFERKLRIDIYPEIGDMRMRDVRASNLQELLNGIEKAKDTVSKVRSTLQQLFTAAETEGIIERNPSLYLELPDGLKEESLRALTKEESNIVWKVANRHKHGTYVLTMQLCGLRRGEAAGLKVEKVNFEKKRIRVKEAIRYRTNQGRVKNPKSQSGFREMPIPDILIPFLIKQCAGKSPGDYVFPCVDGRRPTGTAVRRWWESFLRQCHLTSGAKTYRNALIIETSKFGTDISPQNLRHDYATSIHAAGVHEKEQKSFLGHKSSDVTDRYREVSEESFNRAAGQINNFFDFKYLKRPVLALFFGQINHYASTLKSGEKE